MPGKPAQPKWHLNIVIPEPTPEALARRRELSARMDDLRATMQPLGFSVVDIIREARDPDGDFSSE